MTDKKETISEQNKKVDMGKVLVIMGQSIKLLERLAEYDKNKN